MIDNTNNKVKIRFKFRSGEEFEAEGTPDFIEKQRSDFLQLIDRDGARTSRRAASVHSSQAEEQHPVYTENTTDPAATAPSEHRFPTLNTAEPALFRRKTTPYSPTSTPTPAPRMSVGISAAENARLHPAGLVSEQELRLWEQIIRTDEKMVYLRRKSRQLSPDTAALVLIAAAKVLLQAVEGYSALLLSKSLKKSGYGADRLDRVLGGELKKGTVRSEGTKRSRLYSLSDEGFARAYVLATKLAEEWRV